MTYALPRAAIVFVGWLLTCVVIANLAPGADSTVYLIAAATWAIAGLVLFGYLRVLRRAEFRRDPA